MIYLSKYIMSDQLSEIFRVATMMYIHDVDQISDFF